MKPLGRQPLRTLLAAQLMSCGGEPILRPFDASAVAPDSSPTRELDAQVDLDAAGCLELHEVRGRQFINAHWADAAAALEPSCEAPPELPPLAMQAVVSGLPGLVFAAMPPDLDDWYLVQQTGQIRSFADGRLRASPFWMSLLRRAPTLWEAASEVC